MNVVYDLESFPNFFSACFYDIDTKKYYDFVIHESRDDIDELRKFFNKVDWKIGFNNHGYDDILMRFVTEGKNVTPEAINKLSNLIINSRRDGYSIYKIDSIRSYLKKYKHSIDLMSIHALHKIGVSLKQVGVILRHPKLQDLPKDPADWIYTDEIDDILAYGRNDVAITNLLYEYSKDDIKLRSNVGKQYGVNILSASRTYIAKEILNKYYEKYTGIKLKDFKDLRSYYKNIYLKDIVADFKFKTPELIALYDRIRNTVVDSDFKLSESVSTKEMTHTIGMGGLHSQNKNDIYEEDDEYVLLDVDWGSYYPNIMLKYKIYQRHLSPKYLDILKDLTDLRLKAKKDGDKITADTIKITINSIFGLSGFDNYWLKDDKVMYGTTINGQLLLLGLIEYLESLGDVTCIMSNTDGLSLRVNRNIIDKVLKEVEGIEKHVGIPLEYDFYKKLIFRDVNNYLWISKSDKIKVKGIFNYEQDITKGYRMPIVTKALQEYYINNIPIETTINNESDIYLFCIAQKTGRQFTTYFRTIEGLKKIQKTNRYFVSTKSGSLIKIKEKDDGSVQENQAVAGENVYILNDYINSDLKYYLSILKRQYYIKETNKIINSFKKEQYELF
jgi:hypothetical protein